MKRQLFLLIGVVATLSLHAQTFIPDFDTVEVTRLVTDDEIKAENDLTNPGRGSIELKWRRIVEDIDNWKGTLICDNNTCYGATVSETPDINPYEIDGDTSANLDVYFEHDDKVGEGLVQLLVWDVNDSLNSHYILTYTAKVDPATSAGSKIDENQNIKVYPNPARDYIYLKNLPQEMDVHVEVYNILGRKMAEDIFSASSSSTEQRINVADLQKGIYLVRVFDAQMNILATHSISKMK